MLLFKARLELLKRLDETQLERLVTSRSESIEEESGARWCCAACGNRVTERDQSISIAGKHVHQCTNPDGVLFVIGCFRDVPGCIAVDEPTARFTWFPGYRWQVALCHQCGLQLGWRFLGDDAFYGLILDRLIECGAKTH